MSRNLMRTYEMICKGALKSALPFSNFGNKKQKNKKTNKLKTL